MASYAAHLLPQSGNNLAAYADKYSELRLTALRQSPERFSASIVDELAMTKEERLTRTMQDRRRTVIVTVQSDALDWLNEEWVGSVVLLGPMNKEDYFAPLTIHVQNSANPPKDFTYDGDSASSAAKHEPEDYYHMTALFVEKSHRRRGIAKILCEKSFEVAVDQSGQADVRIFIAPDNVDVFDMYKKLGFRTAVEKITLAEALVASGDPLPAVYDSDVKYSTRLSVVMIRQLGY
ncbi:hypothetical protein CBS101457_006949 [Exobasidium rhododendri]|nr:hypothetical protein CBS101457_006949 [Exobasidium rhododendri]